MEMIDTKQLWKACLSDIETSVSKANFSTWFKNTSIIKDDGGTINIGVPNEFVKDWLSKKYDKLILKTLMGLSDHVRSIEFVITKYEPKQETETQPEQKLFITKEMPLQELYINKDDNLNPRYTFESFIVGQFNELAYAAAQAIIRNPGMAYNPFFIYGSTGLGKTHLIQAIGNEIKKRYPEKKIHYVSVEKFSMDYVNSLQTQKTNAFKEKYRKYDVIIMDDIQFIGSRERTQDELFHLFNSFYETNKPIIFCSDKHPNYIPGLEDRLKSRFASGMIIDINEPDYESRVAILRAKLKENTALISDDAIEYIASAIQGSIRELEGSLNAIIIQAQLKNKVMSLQEVKNLIKHNIKPKKNVSVEDVVKVIAKFYSLEEEMIYEKTRRKEIVKARQMVMFILREDFNVSYPLIGQKLGGKDHTTVIHSFLKVKNDLKTDHVLSQDLEQLRAMFK